MDNLLKDHSQPPNVTNWIASGAQNFSRGYSYDALNRIASMSAPGDTCSGLTWAYDPWGNRPGQNVTGGSCPSPQLSINAQNRLYGGPYQYDAAGNLTNDGNHTYAYDGENRIIKVDNGSTAIYAYDASGKRIRKDAGGTWTEYYYGPNGSVEDEYNGVWTVEYIYLGSQLIAQYKNSTTQFAFTDDLGSTRLVTAMNQGVVDNLDYLPFGEQIAGDTSTTHKFTGKERDSESGLDNFGARYDASSLGRFMTPDPLMASGHVSDPQSWNRYAYALNNPLRFIDPTGMEVAQSCADNKKCQITVKVNVVWDKTANNGKGLTDKQKADFTKNQVDKAVKDYAKSGIKLDVSYTEGSFTVDSNNNAQFTGLQSDAVNVVASNQTYDGSNESTMTKSGTAITLINVNDVHDSNAFPLFTNTTEHELAHQFIGDASKPNSSLPGYILNEFNVDGRVQGQHMGISQTGFREGLEPRSYANPTNPEAIKPQTH